MPNNIRIRIKADEFKRKLNIKDGKDGERGTVGSEGKTGKAGPKGLRGLKGEAGKPGKKGINGKDGEDGANGSPDTPIEIRDKLETLDGSYRLDAKAIKNLPSLVVGGNERRPFIKTVSDTASVDLAVSNGNLTATVLPAGVDHNSLANLTTGDPHTQYRLESADHTHQSTGLQGGTLDHGLALTGLTDDDHTQYALLAGRSGGQTLIGGTATTDDLILRSTSGVGNNSSDIIFQQGNNGAIESGRFKAINSAGATGGTITTDGDYTIHSFTTSGDFVSNASMNVEYLVVAGGGGGGGNDGGGGGAGGYRTATGFAVTAQTYSITIGGGGAGGVGETGKGTNGNDSVFSTITSTGGGGGGVYAVGSRDGKAGGSGGGAGMAAGGGGTGGAGNTPSTTPSQGNNGGDSSALKTGGGGGASAAGQTGLQGGVGGAGTASSISGSSVTRGGGGGGGYTASAGGAGGGGAGAGTAGNGVAGTTNTGSGGGGGGDGPGNSGGAGGSGIVIIKYLTADSTSPSHAGLGIRNTNPTALLHLGAGTASANTAPLKFNTGTLLTTAEAGAVEFLTDKFYGTITTGAARAELTLNDAALTATRVPFATTNGRLTDDADMTFATDTLTVTKIAATTLTGLQTYADAVNMTFNATTGTKIGTATTQKLAFYNATPIVQPTGIIDADGTLADITTKFNALLAKLEALGLQAVA